MYVVAGSLTVDTPEGSVEMVDGDYGLLPVGTTHAFRNTSGEPVSSYALADAYQMAE